MTPTILHGDMLDALSWMEDGTFHACVTDPPYHLSTAKRFGGENAAPAQHGRDGLYARASAGFMGKKWDGGDIAFRPETWAEVLRVLKPGGHLLCFGGTRTFHRMAVAIEDAGFEIRDCLMWLYAKGFPKSHDAARAVDKALGVKGSAGETRLLPSGREHHFNIGYGAGEGYDSAPAGRFHYLPGSPEAAAWSGWGTALKPAWEPIILARKPLVGTVAQNLLAHGAGAINVDACRIHCFDVAGPRFRHGGGVKGAATSYEMPDSRGAQPPGRWPANVAHDGSEEVETAFAAFGEKRSGTGAVKRATGTGYSPNALGAESRSPGTPNVEYGDAGSASRFFYCGKATAADRAGSKHPTVKPVSLMRWLVRMVTPPGGRVLDPFAGSGTTGAAAQAEGFACTLIDAEAEYIADMQRRFGLLEDVFA